MTNQREGLDNALVWLLILHWNGLDNTRACLNSLAHVTYPSLRTVVIDNGSTDGSADIIEKEFPWVHLVRLYANVLVTIGRNVGMRLALQDDADFVAFLDNDTEVEPDFLAELISAANANPRAGFAGPKILYHNERGKIWSAGTRIVRPLGWIHHLGIRHRDDGSFDAARDVDALAGCCLAVKRQVIEEIGTLDPNYIMYTEDTDWCARAAASGWTAVYVPTARVYHKVSASSGGGLTYFKAYHRVISTWRFFRNHGRWWHWPTIFLFVGAGYAALTLIELKRRNLSGLKGLYRAAFDIATQQNPPVMHPSQSRPDDV